MALVKKWLLAVDARSAIPSKHLQRKIALSLLRGWRSYLKSGICPWTKKALYDYTYFLHAFAQRYSGPDDQLYQWLSSQGLKMLDILNGTGDRKRCRICGWSVPFDGDGTGTLCRTCAGSTLLRSIGP